MEKREVKPFINAKIKDTIYKLSDITNYSVKRICEDICNHAFKSDISDELSPYFRRGVIIDGMSFSFNENATKFEPSFNEKERVSMKLNTKLYGYAYYLSYAMECSVAKVVAYAIEKGFNDSEFLIGYVNESLNKRLKGEHKEEFYKLISLINNDSNEELDVLNTSLYIKDEYGDFDKGLNKLLKEVFSYES